MRNIVKEHLILDSINSGDLYEAKGKLRPPQVIAEVLKEKTALRYSKSFPRVEEFYMYHPGMGIYVAFSNSELIVLLNKIFQYSEIPPLPMPYLESLAKTIRLSAEANFGEALCDFRHIVYTNGTYDIETDTLREWSPDVFQTVNVQMEHTEGCPLTLFLTYINEFCGGYQDRVECIRAWMCNMITAYTEGQVLLYILGPGGTGKSQLANIITALVGKPFVITTTLRDLHNDRFEASNLKGKKLCIINDTEHYKGDMSVIKQIVGGDSLRGRRKNIQGSFEIEPRCLVMIIGNYPLGSRDTSGALGRRCRIFPAETISEKRVALLSPKSEGQWDGLLKNELSGIMNWALYYNKPANRAIGRKYLTEQDKMVPSLKEYAKESIEALNPIIAWVQDEIEPGDGAFVGFTMKRDLQGDLELKRRRTLYPTFKRWAERREINILGHKTFTSDLLLALRNLGYNNVSKIRKTEGMFIDKIKIKDYVYDKDHVTGSTLQIGASPGPTSEVLSPENLGYSPPKKDKQHPALTPDLSKRYIDQLNKTEKKVYLNKEVKSYFSSQNASFEDKLASEYLKDVKNPSEAYRKSVLEVVRKGIQSVTNFGAIPYSYKPMATSPRIYPQSYGDSVNHVKRIVREEAYSYMGEVACREFNCKILDYDLKSCFTSLLLGLYTKELQVLQYAIEVTGLWEYIRQEFIKEGKGQWYNKKSVKICVYSSFFQGGGNAMIKGVMEQYRKDLGLLASEFRKLPDYEKLSESARKVAEVMQNSPVIMDFRRISEEIKMGHLGDFLVGPTGHAYMVTQETFPTAYANYLQSFEFALMAETTLRIKKKFPEIEVIGHFHDGNVLLIPEAIIEETKDYQERVLKELGYSLGLSYKQTLEVKNQWPPLVNAK